MIAGKPLAAVLPRLDTLIMILKTCKGRTCHSPWESLHPDGNVRSLEEALHPKYDSFYETQPKMEFYGCPPAYRAEMESQEPLKTYSGKVDVVDQSFDYTNHWHLLV